MKKRILQYPDEILLRVCLPIDLLLPVDFVENLITDLTDTMMENEGIGLASPQIGVLYKVMVYKDKEVMKHLINPIIVGKSEKKKSYGERCLSCNGIMKDIRRWKNVNVKGYILKDGEYKEVFIRSRKKLLSFVLQHEIDHLNGITIMEG